MTNIDTAAAEIRAQGDATEDAAVVELSLPDGGMSWANEFFLKEQGVSIGALRGLSIFEMIPPEFHAQAREALAEKAAGRPFRPAIWPARMPGSDKVSWWYVYQGKSSAARHWSWMELVQTTALTGERFSFMRLQMELLWGQTRDRERLEAFEAWTRGKLDEQAREMGELKSMFVEAIYAARAAAASADATRMAADRALGAVDETKGQLMAQLAAFQRSQATHEEAIMELITTDARHDKRIESFEKHVKMTTDLAVDAIRKAAAQGGKSLQRKVTVPVTVIAALATLVQWVIQAFGKG